MKKFALVFLMLCIALFAVSASAETFSYMMTGAVTADGQQVDITNTEDFPVLVFVLDTDTLECAFGTEEEVVEGTCELAETDDENMLVATASLTDGTVINLIYVVEDDSFAYVDAETGVTFVLMNIEDLEEAAA